MEYCEGDVKTMAREIRYAFVTRKRQFEAAYRPKSDRHQRIWEKAARICLENDITNAEEFVEAQFRGIHNPYPNVLTNRHQAVQRLKEHRQESTDKGKAEIYVNSQMDNVLARARTGLDMRRYLTEPLEQICPLIRYVVALTLGHADIAASLKAEATEYAKRNPDVVEVLKGRFPGVKECHQMV